MTTASNLREIAQELRRLQRYSPTCHNELADWYADSRRFVEWQHSKFPEVELPSEVMSYLHDADIRLKDPDYRMAQDKALEQVIYCLNLGIVPGPIQTTISIHPRWIAIIVLAMLAYAFYWAVR